MKKKNLTIFGKFNYKILPEVNDQLVNVECSFTYKGKNVKHYLSYYKDSTKKEAFYLNQAKKDIAKLRSNGKLEKSAKRYLKMVCAKNFKPGKYNAPTTGNYAPRSGGIHIGKKPLIITGCVLLAGAIATGATFLTLHFLNNKPVTPTDSETTIESEIDNHLIPPRHLHSANFQFVYNTVFPEYVRNLEGYDIRESDPLFVGSRLKSATVKNVSGQGWYEKANPNEPVHMPNAATPQIFDTADPAVDSSEFYVSGFTKPNKKVNSSTIKLEYRKDPLSAHIVADDSLEQTSNGITSTQNVHTTSDFLYEQIPGVTDFRTFEYDNFAFDRGGPKYQSYTHFSDYRRSSDAEKGVTDRMSMLLKLYGRIEKNIEDPDVNSFFTSDDSTDLYCYYPLAYNLVEDADYWARSDYLGQWFQTTQVTEFIARFSDHKEYGWTLKEIAINRSVVVNYNDLGEYLEKPISLYKSKQLVTFEYGEVTNKTDTSITYQENYPNPYSRYHINMKGNYTSGQPTIEDQVIPDTTLVLRTFDPDSDTYEFYNSSIMFMPNAIYALFASGYDDADGFEIGFEDLTTESQAYFTKDETMPLPSGKHAFVPKTPNIIHSVKIKLNNEEKIESCSIIPVI